VRQVHRLVVRVRGVEGLGHRFFNRGRIWRAVGVIGGMMSCVHDAISLLECGSDYLIMRTRSAARARQWATMRFS
jgi:hypothetical protein